MNAGNPKPPLPFPATPAIPQPYQRPKKWITRVCLLLVITLGLVMIWLLLGPWAENSAILNHAQKETEKSRTTLQAKNNALNRDIQAHQNDAEQMQRRQKKLADELDDLRSHAKVVIDHNNKLENQVRQQGGVIAGFKQQCKSPDEIARLRRSNNQARLDLNKARKVAENSMQIIRALRDKLSARDHAAKEAKDDAANSKRELQALSATNRELASENQELKARKPVVIPMPARAANPDDTEKLRSQLAEARRQVDELSDANEDLISRIAEFTSKLSRMENTQPSQPGLQPVRPFAILNFNAQFNIATANFGSEQGAQPGMRYHVERDGRRISQLVARKVEFNRSALGFAPGASKVVLKPGDLLLPAGN